MTETLKEKCYVIDGGETREELPMFLQEGGEMELNERRKELEVFVKLLKTAPRVILSKTKVLLNPDALKQAKVGVEMAKTLDAWWKLTCAGGGMSDWLMNNDHKVNGKFGNWSAGFLGSRWADCDISGRRCRIAFYSRKTDPQIFPQAGHKMYKTLIGVNYILKIDPEGV